MYSLAIHAGQHTLTLLLYYEYDQITIKNNMKCAKWSSKLSEMWPMKDLKLAGGHSYFYKKLATRFEYRTIRINRGTLILEAKNQ